MGSPGASAADQDSSWLFWAFKTVDKAIEVVLGMASSK
jgi:hypothetical protein